MADHLTGPLTALSERGTHKGAAELLEAARREATHEVSSRRFAFWRDGGAEQAPEQAVVVDIENLARGRGTPPRPSWAALGAIAASVLIVVLIAVVALGDRSENTRIVTDQPEPSPVDTPAPSTPEPPPPAPENADSSGGSLATDATRSGVRIIDIEPRNPEGSQDDFGLGQDGLFPLAVGYGPNGHPWIVYWVALSAGGLEPLPEAVVDAITWGSVRIARCTDPDCAGEIEVSSAGLSVLQPYAIPAVSVAALPDGSLVMIFSEALITAVTNSGYEHVPVHWWVACGNTECSDPVVRSLDEVIDDPVNMGNAQVVVSGSGLPVIAYTTGPTESDLLKVAICEDPMCESISDVVDIAQPVITFDLFVDSEGDPAVLYSKWKEQGTLDQGTWLARCSDSRCSNDPSRVVLTQFDGGVYPMVRRGAELTFWVKGYEPEPDMESQLAFGEEPVAMTLVECLDSSCEQTRTLPALTQLTSSATNQDFTPDPLCGEQWAISPDGKPTIFWCSGDMTPVERTLVECDDIACTTGTQRRIPPEAADGSFAHILHSSTGDPILVLGSQDSTGLGLAYLGLPDE